MVTVEGPRARTYTSVTYAPVQAPVCARFDLKTEKTRTETHFKFLAVELSTELSLRYICSFLENNFYQYGKSIIIFYEIHCSIFV